MKCVDQNQGEFYGMESWGKAFYKEIAEPKKIIYTDYFSDGEGKENDGQTAGPSKPFEAIGDGGFAVVARPGLRLMGCSGCPCLAPLVALEGCSVSFGPCPLVLPSRFVVSPGAEVGRA
jgi:hypothetical protein